LYLAVFNQYKEKVSLRKIFISNIPIGIKNRELRSLFIQFGEIHKVFIINKKQPFLKGFVIFAHSSSVKLALRCKKLMLRKNLFIKIEGTKPKNSKLENLEIQRRDRRTIRVQEKMKKMKKRPCGGIKWERQRNDYPVIVAIAQISGRRKFRENHLHWKNNLKFRTEKIRVEREIWSMSRIRK